MTGLDVLLNGVTWEALPGVVDDESGMPVATHEGWLTDAELWNDLASGIEWHAYWWGQDDDPEAARANLIFDGLNVRWYKYPGRGESVDRPMPPDAWAEWLSKALAAARLADVEFLRP